MALVDIIRGKSVHDVPPAVYEALFATVYKWPLSEIRSLSERDFKIHVPMVNILFTQLCQKAEL